MISACVECLCKRCKDNECKDMMCESCKDAIAVCTGFKQERIKVKGHYRVVARDTDGCFTYIKKWQAPKRVAA